MQQHPLLLICLKGAEWFFIAAILAAMKKDLILCELCVSNESSEWAVKNCSMFFALYAPNVLNDHNVANDQTKQEKLMKALITSITGQDGS